MVTSSARVRVPIRIGSTKTVTFARWFHVVWMPA